MGLFYKVIIGTNTLLFFFSLAIVGFSAATIANFDRSVDSFFTRGDFGWFLFAGLLGCGVALMACVAASNPFDHYNLLFCYFFILSNILIFLSVGFYLYRVLVLNLEASADGNVESAFRLESAKEFNDFVLSAFVFCCTGCHKTDLPECVRDIEPIGSDPNFCDQESIGIFGETDPANVDCLMPKKCGLGDLNINEGLDQGCFINAQIVPPYEIFNNVCVFFEIFATNEDEIPIVGPVSQRSCGRGSPKGFVDDVFSFMSKNYNLIATFWGFGILVTFVAWFGSLTMLLCPRRYDDYDKW